MKRILIFSLAYYPHVGGGELAIREITNRIQDIEFHMVTMRFSPTEAREEKIGNVFVHRIGRNNGRLNKFLFQGTAALKAFSLHRRYRFDAVWAMMAHSSGIPAGIFKTVHPDVPYLLTLQEGDPPEQIERLARPVWPLFKRGFTCADELQAISTFLLNWGKRMGFKGEGVLIPDGADIGRFSAPFSREECETLRRSLGVDEKETVLISTSRLVHKNALDDVIRSLAFLPESVRFINIGFGPDRKMLQELAQHTRVEKRTMLLDHLDNALLPNYLHAGDIFIRPSRSEGMGVSFIEAMAAGLPVIATQEGGIADFLFDAKRDSDKETTGWAVDKDSPEQIAEAVRDILAHPGQVGKVTATAKKLVTENYDWDLVADKMKTLFARLLKNR